jgi:hypothetical protein
MEIEQGPEQSGAKESAHLVLGRLMARSDADEREFLRELLAYCAVSALPVQEAVLERVSDVFGLGIGIAVETSEVGQYAEVYYGFSCALAEEDWLSRFLRSVLGRPPADTRKLTPSAVMDLLDVEEEAFQKQIATARAFLIGHPGIAAEISDAAKKMQR